MTQALGDRFTLTSRDRTRSDITPGLVAEIEASLRRWAPAAARAAVAGLHPADLARVIERMDEDMRVPLLLALDDSLEPDVFSHLDAQTRESVVAGLGPDTMAKALQSLDADDAVLVLEDLDEARRKEILAAMPRLDRELITQGLEFPTGSAGRLMRRGLVAVPLAWSVGDTMDYLRASNELPAEFYDIFVIDDAYRPVGSVALSTLLRAERAMSIANLMSTKVYTVDATLAQEAVAVLFRRYGLVEVPVTGDGGRLLGVITFDDLVQVVEREAEADFLSLGGVAQSATPSGRSFRRALMSRGRWLMINLLTAIAASLVIGMFEATIRAETALAILLPIVASMGGNTGTQSLTLAVRALSSRDDADLWRLLRRESLLATGNGIAMGLISALVAWVWFGLPMVAASVGIATAGTMAVGGFAGAAVPMALQRAGVDPAVAAGVFVSTVTDIFGFAAFLALALLIVLP